MPLVDMPLAQLKRYKGRNPKPAGHAAFWARALKEMRSTDPAVELVPSDFEVPYAECFDLYFTGVRRARIHAKYIRPKNAARPHPAILHFPGYSDSAGEWSDKLPYVALGFSVAAFECRGQGGKSVDTGGVKGTTLSGQLIRGLDDCPDNLLFRHILLDTAELASVVMAFPEVAPNRVGAFGGSQGGGLALGCAALEPRVKRVVAFYPFLCDYKRAWEMQLPGGAYMEPKWFFRHFDPRHERAEEYWTRLGYIDIQHLAARIRAEVLMAVGLMDEGCPPSVQFAAFNKIRSKKRAVLFPDFGHEELPGFRDTAFQFLAKL